MKSEIINIEELHDVIISFARGDFSKRLNYNEDQEERNVIVAGINMLGEELREKTISRDYFSGIYNAISEMLIILDMNGKISDMNEVCEKTLTIIKSEWIGRDINEMLNTSIPNHLNRLIKEESGETIRFRNKINAIPLECSLSIISDSIGNQRSVLLLASDITEKLLHENNILRATIEGQENERKRISYDLHDSLGQELNGVIMYLNVLETMVPGSESYNNTLDEVKGLVQQSIHSVRNISFNLMPSILLKETLGNCITEMVRRLNIDDRRKINLNVDLDCVKFSDSNDEILIFRIVQEFVNNSLKHSEASAINISMQMLYNNYSSIQVILNDNGKGFHMNNVLKYNGLNSILTRMDALNTGYLFTSTPNKGTGLNFILNGKTYQDTAC